MISTKKKILFTAIPVTLVLVAAYLGYTGYRSRLHYNDIKNAPQWSPRLFNADEELGYAAVPNYRGALVIARKYRVPAYHDEDGFRVDSAELEGGAVKRPLILTLGDSFSYGYGIEAKETYAHLVAEAIGGTSKNAGGNGFGLAQMLILARRHIPAMKPDYVLVQYSPWVTSRAMHPFAPTNLVTLPTPFFYESDGSMKLARPYFRAVEHDLPIADYCETERSVGDFLSFLFRVGFPSRLHGDFHFLVYRVRRALGMVPVPTKNRVWLENFFYQEVAELCRENGSRMVIVAIGNWQGTTGLQTGLIPPGVAGVRTDHAMWKALEEATQRSFIDAFAIRWGEILNAHHNAAANRIMAKSVLEGDRRPAPDRWRGGGERKSVAG